MSDEPDHVTTPRTPLGQTAASHLSTTSGRVRDVRKVILADVKLTERSRRTGVLMIAAQPQLPQCSQDTRWALLFLERMKESLSVLLWPFPLWIQVMRSDTTVEA